MDQYFNEAEIKQILSKHRKKIPSKGIDKIGIHQIKKNIDIFSKTIVKKYSEDTYEFSPYLELLKPKSRGQFPRLISVPTIRDRVVLTITNKHLSDIFKDIIKRKRISFEIRKVSALLNFNKTKDIFFVKIDIKNYYPSINREILLSQLDRYIQEKKILRLIERAIGNVTVPRDYSKFKKSDYISHIGIPQGIPISNILAEIYLSEVDQFDSNCDIFQIRWVDDIFVLGNCERQVNERSIKIQNILSQLKVEINRDKSNCIACKLASQKFLGYNFTPNIISISQENVEKFLQNLAKKLTLFKRQYENMTERPKFLINDSALVSSFIEILNEKITGAVSDKARYGWLFYFSESTDNAQIYFVEKKIKEMTSKLKFIDQDRLKKISKAFYEIKYNFSNSKYFHNYDLYDTLTKKIHFLRVRGYISPNEHHTDEEIRELFEKYKKKNLGELEKDISYRYI